MTRNWHLRLTAKLVETAAAASLVLSGCTAAARDIPSYTIRRSGARIQLHIDNLIANSDVIARGRIAAVGPARWNTSDGALPAGVAPGNLPPGLAILTDSQFRLTEILKGAVSDDAILVRTSGGTVDGVTVVYDDKVPLEQGQEYLLFLRQDHEMAPQMDAAFFPTRIYSIRAGQATSPDDEWPIDNLTQHIRTTLAAPDPSGLADFLARRYEEVGVPVAALQVMGGYVEVVYATDATPIADTPQDELHRFLIATEIELVRTHGFSVASYGIGAQDTASNRFGWWYGSTLPDEALWLDEYPSAFTDDELGSMIRERLDLRGLTLAELEVSTDDGLQTVWLQLVAPSADEAAGVVVEFANSLRPLFDEINAEGGHVIRIRFMLNDASGNLLVDNIRDLRVGMEGGWLDESMPRDWRTEAEQTAEPF